MQPSKYRTIPSAPADDARFLLPKEILTLAAETKGKRKSMAPITMFRAFLIMTPHLEREHNPQSQDVQYDIIWKESV